MREGLIIGARDELARQMRQMSRGTSRYGRSSLTQADTEIPELAGVHLAATAVRFAGVPYGVPCSATL
ncbi:hypothetical protein WMF38_44210 [Sorangium sp. So ce118]